MKTKVILCGTHPDQFNGYSKVVFELSKELSTSYPDMELYVFGFQNFYDNITHKIGRSLPNVKDIYDAHKHEEPKAKGFGESLINEYVLKVQPDIVVVYNDLVVITNIIKKLNEIPNRKFKIVPYIDIVYKNEKNHMIQFINDKVDGGIMFTDYWKKVIKEQGFTKPLGVLEHGFNKETFYPIPKKVARKFYNVDENSFVIVNLNRNQPRKRWDICIMSYVKFIKNHLEDNIKLMISTSLKGGWDLVDIMHSECRKNGITFEQLKRHLIIIQNPQQVTDREINVMYNVADIGINTCDGEGFGLCNFEQAGIGIPQIVPKVGGFLDFMQKSYCVMVSPQWSYYTDHSRDFVSGEAEVCSVDDFVEAMEFYYKNKKLVTKYGEKSRSVILEKYAWKDKAKQFYDIVMDFTKDHKIEESKMEDGIIDIERLMHECNDDDVSHAVEVSDVVDSTPVPVHKEPSPPTPETTSSVQEPSKPVEVVSEPSTPDNAPLVNIDQLISEKLGEKVAPSPLKGPQIDSDDEDDDEVIVIDGGS